MRGSDDVTLTQGSTLASFMRSYACIAKGLFVKKEQQMNTCHNFSMKEKKISAAFFLFVCFALLVFSG